MGVSHGDLDAFVSDSVSYCQRDISEFDEMGYMAVALMGLAP